MPWSPAPWSSSAARTTPWLMSDDCSWMADRIPHELQSNWYSLFVYPMRLMTRRVTACTSTYASERTSPATTTSPVVHSVSQATFELASRRRNSSRMASEIWSETLSGCPSDTDSDVNKKPIVYIVLWYRILPPADSPERPHPRLTAVLKRLRSLNPLPGGDLAIPHKITGTDKRLTWACNYPVNK